MSQSIVFTCKMLDINAKKFKKQILSSNWGLKHLFAGLNIQHLHKTLQTETNLYLSHNKLKQVCLDVQFIIFILLLNDLNSNGGEKI